MSALRAAELDQVLYGPMVASVAIGDSFAFIAIVLRFLARRLDQKSLWYDDFLVIPSLAATLAGSFTSWATFGNNRIPGNDPLVLSPDMRVQFLKVYYLYQTIGPLAHACYKLSLLTLLLRMFRTQRTFCNFVRGAIGILTLWTIALSLASLFQCRPVDKLWHQEKPGICVNPTPLVSAIDFSNIGLGLIVFGLLITRILRSDLIRAQRKRWLTTFITGLSVLFIGCAMAYFDVFQLMPFFRNETYSIDGAVMFYLLEINMGVICACVPVLPPVFRLCCAPRNRKSDESDSKGFDSNTKVLELEADDPCLELGDPLHATRDASGRLRAELLDTKINRGELHGASPVSELPTIEKHLEIDGREVSYSPPLSRADSPLKQKALPALPIQADCFF